MSQRKTHDGFYVTARLGSGGNARTAWLSGPYTGPRGLMAAIAMVEPVRRAVNRHSDDPRFAFAGFGTAKMTLPIERPLPAGVMSMEWCDDDYINDVINASIKP